MKKILLSGAILFYASIVMNAQSKVNINWASYFGSIGSPEVTGVETTSNGDYIIVGNCDTTISFASNIRPGLGSRDGFLAKISASGTLIWCKYVGGEKSDFFTDLALDDNDNIYLSGYTWSSSGIAFNGFKNTNNAVNYPYNSDAFVQEYNAQGVLIWGTFYGDTDWDEGHRIAIAYTVSNVPKVVLYGATNSSSNIASGGFQNTIAGGWDYFLVQFDVQSKLRNWASYLGGENSEGWSQGATAIGDIATDRYGTIYVCGGTNSCSGFGTSGAHQPNHSQCPFSGSSYYDGFVTKISTSGSKIWSTYYGGGGNEKITGIAVDGNNGNVYALGYGASYNNISYNGYYNNYNGSGTPGFLVKFDASGTRLWATYIGLTCNTQTSKCFVDDFAGIAPSIILTGQAGCLADTFINHNGFNPYSNNKKRAFAMKFKFDGSIEWGTFWGSSGDEAILDAMQGANGNFIMVGTTNGQNLEGSSSGFQPIKGSANSSGIIGIVKDQTYNCANCVWPGDADNNGVVDNFDLLPISVGFGRTGSIRSAASTQWFAQKSVDWSSAYQNLINYKYADTDGSGLINNSDVNAINLNWSQIHSKTDEQRGINGAPFIYSKIVNDTIRAKDTVTIEVWLGDSIQNILDAYAFAFDLKLNQDIIDMNSVQILYKDNWLDTITNLVSCSKIDTNLGKLYLAIGKTNQQSKSGFGKIATVKAVAKSKISGVGIMSDLCVVSRNNSVNSFGEELTLNSVTDSVLIDGAPSSIEEGVTSKIKIYPSPAKDILLVENIPLHTHLVITNILGETVWEQVVDSERFAIGIAYLPSGMYFLDRRKIVKQ